MPLSADKQLELQTLIDELCDDCAQGFPQANQNDTENDTTTANTADRCNQQLNDLLLNDPDAQRYYLHQIDIVNELRWQLTGEATHRSITQLKQNATRPPVLQSNTLTADSRRETVSTPSTQNASISPEKQGETAHAPKLWHFNYWRKENAPRWPFALAAGCAMAAVLALVAYMSFYQQTPEIGTPPAIAGSHNQPNHLTPGEAENVRHTEPKTIASIQQIAGHITVTTPNGRVRNLLADPSVLSGDTLTTDQIHSATKLTFKDSTQLAIGNNSSIHFQQVNAKYFAMNKGKLEASVRPQPKGRPMRIFTPNALIQVVGTKFTLDVTPDHTELCVTQGTVKIQRSQSDTWINVPAGQRIAISNANTQQLVTSDIPQPSNTWSQQLNKTSASIIQSNANWSHGLLNPTSKTHLIITYKASIIGKAKTVLTTRNTTNQPGVQFFTFNQLNITKPDHWHTATIPLSALKSTTNPGIAYAISNLPIQMTMSPLTEPMTLTIGEVKLIPAGPGKPLISPH